MNLPIKGSCNGLDVHTPLKPIIITKILFITESIWILLIQFANKYELGIVMFIILFIILIIMGIKRLINIMRL
jgi:hypothetical protein